VIAVVATNTMLAPASGALFAYLTTWKKFKRPDLSMTVNGMLAGLVPITAPCAFVTAPSAVEKSQGTSMVPSPCTVQPAFPCYKKTSEVSYGITNIHVLPSYYGRMSSQLLLTYYQPAATA
jgi:Amt family ammonium transporter